MKSLFNLETSLVESNDKNETSSPYFDISLKKLDPSNKDDNVDQIQNPIKWFGVLVPQSLKSAQKHFQEAVYLSVELANIQAQLQSSINKIKSLKPLRNDAA